MAINVASLMSKLSEERGAFHSEADFQLAFAWELQRQHPGAQIRLETRPTRGQHLDVLMRADGRDLAIELKYLTAAWDGADKGEELHLLNHGAQDIRVNRPGFCGGSHCREDESCGSTEEVQPGVA